MLEDPPGTEFVNGLSEAKLDALYTQWAEKCGGVRPLERLASMLESALADEE